MNSERGKHGGRANALWGSGSRNGESRSSVLWGKSGRGLLLATVASLAMVIPFAAGAGDGRDGIVDGTYVAPSLWNYAKGHSGDTKVKVIIQSTDAKGKAAKDAIRALELGNGSQGRGMGNFKNLDLINGLAGELRVSDLKNLAKYTSLVITADAPVKVSGNSPSSDQLWPYETGNANLWTKDASVATSVPTIAIVDSGVQQRGDFTKDTLLGPASRILASVNLSSLPNNSPGDGRGHGTFVAGVAAGSAAKYAGAMPSANLVSLDVMDDTGMGLTSDIIKACGWILEHKAEYNIKVANFSLHSAITAPFFYDPLDQAVEKLWFGGVTVVVAAGNYGSATGPSGVLFSPGNDPFVITVGAADLGGTMGMGNDTVAPWSAWGYTKDGFAKPELSAAGRYMLGPVPAGSTLTKDKPANVLAGGTYMQLSGTSFAAPVVAGSAAQILARHPNWTPNQVKGALMLTARSFPGKNGSQAGGVGEVTASKAADVSNPPNPNLALSRYVSGAGTGGQAFDSASWLNAAQTNASWNSASWDSASWASASWASASWASASWASASWASASWLDASWLDASWVDVSSEDAAEGDAAGDATAYTLDASDIADALADPDLAPDPSVLPTAP